MFTLSAAPDDADAKATSLKPDDSGAFIVKPLAMGEHKAIRVATSAAQMLPTPRTEPAPKTTSPTADAPHEPLRIDAAASKAVKLPDFAPPKAPARSDTAPSRQEPGRQKRTEATGPAMQQGQLTGQPALGMPAAGTSVQPPADRVRIDLKKAARASRAVQFEQWRRRVRVSARKLNQPQGCACCLSTADGSFDAVHVREKGSKTSQHLWTFPYCSRCIDHVQRARAARRRSAIVGWLTAAILIGFGLVMQLWVAAALGAPIGGLSVFALVRRSQFGPVRQRLSPQCACMGPAVRFTGFYGSVQTFDFANEEFAVQFERANSGKLVG